ncbi:MAG: hypothetical protein PVG61_07425 [Dehalococcoidia bacterium]|jgi:uncharacterized BrkB/YihY/UPF0761 family membrane protein
MATEEVLNLDEAVNIDEAAPSTERLKVVRRVLFIAFFVLMLSMIFVGLRIFVGYILGCLASVSLVTALTCRWQRIRNFLYLILFTVLIAIIYSMIHVEVLTRVVTAIFGDAVLDNIGWKIFDGLASNILLFFVPACGLVGVVGSIVLYTRRVIERVQKRT